MARWPGCPLMDTPSTAPRPRSTDGTSQLSTLRQVAHALTSDTNSRDILQTLCDAALLHAGAHGAAVAQVSPNGGVFVAGCGVGSELVGVEFPLEGTVTARVIQEQRTIAIDSALHGSSPFFQQLLAPLGIGPILVLPRSEEHTSELQSRLHL